MSLNSPVGLGLNFPAEQFAPGGLAPTLQGLIADPGTEPPSGGPVSGTNQVYAGLYWASRVLTVAQCRTLNSVPQTMVVATPNSLILPVLLVGRLINPGATPFNVNVAVACKYTGGPNAAGPMNTGLQNFFSNSGATAWFDSAPIQNHQYLSGSGVDVRGRDLVVYGNQDCTGGNAAAFCQLWVLYTRLLSTQ